MGKYVVFNCNTHSLLDSRVHDSYGAAVDSIDPRFNDCLILEVVDRQPFFDSDEEYEEEWEDDDEEPEGRPCVLCGSKEIPLHTNGVCGNCWTEPVINAEPTEGPWRLVSQNDEEFLIVGPEHISDEECEHIALIYGLGSPTCNIGKANAELLVRARELFDTLDDLIDQLDGIGVPDWNGAEGLELEPARQLVNSFKKPPSKG